MKGKLVKRSNDRFDLYSIEDKNQINTIASSFDNPIGKLSLKNCEAIELGYDLDELVSEEFQKFDQEARIVYRRQLQESLAVMFNKAVEILGDKKFTENNIDEAFDAGYEMLDSPKNYNDVLKEFKESLEPTEWDVEIVMDKDCYSSAGRCDKLTMADCIICTPVTYLKDADGCLILKRI